MGQKSSKERLHTIQANVQEIDHIIRITKLSAEARDRYEEILHGYGQEIKFILSKSVKASKLSRLQKLIQTVLQELDGIQTRSTLDRIDSDINYMTRLHWKEKSLRDLDSLSKSLGELNGNLNLHNYRGEKETFIQLKRRVDSIQEVSKEVEARKSQVFEAVAGVEDLFGELEMEDKLREVEGRHCANMIDLRRFVGVVASGCYKNHRKFLEELRGEVEGVSEVSEKVVVRKRYLLFNIDNNMAAMERKARENEEKIRKQVERGCPSANRFLVDNLVDNYKQLEEEFSVRCDVHELKEIWTRLTDFRMKIDQKLEELEGQMVHCEEKVQHMKENSGGDSMESIRKDLESVRKQVENSTYARESPECRKIIRKLEDYRTEVKYLGNGKFQDNILKYISDTRCLLENNMSKQESVSGDILIDIISVSTDVNELGNKIQKNDWRNTDFDSIESNLEEHLDYLKKLKISPGRTNVCKFRDFIILQIDSHLSNLRKIKLNENIEHNKNKLYLI